MDGGEPALHVGARAHLLRGPHEDAHGSGVHLPEEGELLRLGVGVVDERHLALGHAARHELAAQIVVHVEGPVALRGGEVAEHELGEPFLGAVAPYAQHVLAASVHLAALEVGQRGVGEALVEGYLAAVVGDEEHVVLLGGHTARPHRLGALGEPRHQLALDGGGLHRHVAQMHLGRGKRQRVRRLHVGDLFEHGHELG